jgi:hypothetical protein
LKIFEIKVFDVEMQLLHEIILVLEILNELLNLKFDSVKEVFGSVGEVFDFVNEVGLICCLWC